jgi:hypothetical protein
MAKEEILGVRNSTARRDDSIRWLELEEEIRASANSVSCTESTDAIAFNGHFHGKGD